VPPGDDETNIEEPTIVEEASNEGQPPPKERQNRYNVIVEDLFFITRDKGDPDMCFKRADIEEACKRNGIKLPSNLGDVLYNARYRYGLPQRVLETAPEGREWAIFPDGRGKYRFQIVRQALFLPSTARAVTKVPDSTPGPIAKYAMNDEQALLAKLRYNRLIDLFTGVVCYSLQNHLRTTVKGMGQVETDELYVGIDRHGAHHVIPIQAKAGEDKINVVQIYQDYGVSKEKYPGSIARPIGAQFMRNNTIALLEFTEEGDDDDIVLLREIHYQLVPFDQITPQDLHLYRQRVPSEDARE
jgi:hypothetical protein